MTPALSQAAPAARCPFCGRAGVVNQTGIRDFHVREGDSPEFTAVYCAGCEVAYSAPYLDRAELSSYYPQDYEAYVPHRGFRARLQSLKYAADLRTLRRYGVRPNALLFELGAGRGEFLAAARDRGFRVTGVEPGAAGRETARATYGIELAAAPGEELRFANRCEVVVARRVVEHLVDPLGVLSRIFRDGLQSGGVLFLKTPALDSWEAELFGPYWCGWDMPRHRVHFTTRGMRRTLEELGFRDVRVRREIVPVDVLASLAIAGRFGGRLWARLLSLPFLPSALRLLLAQALAVALSPWGPGRLVAVARKP